LRERRRQQGRGLPRGGGFARARDFFSSLATLSRAERLPFLLPSFASLVPATGLLRPGADTLRLSQDEACFFARFSATWERTVANTTGVPDCPPFVGGTRSGVGLSLLLVLLQRHPAQTTPAILGRAPGPTPGSISGIVPVPFRGLSSFATIGPSRKCGGFHPGLVFQGSGRGGVCTGAAWLSAIPPGKGAGDLVGCFREGETLLEASGRCTRPQDLVRTKRSEITRDGNITGIGTVNAVVEKSTKPPRSADWGGSRFSCARRIGPNPDEARARRGAEIRSSVWRWSCRRAASIRFIARLRSRRRVAGSACAHSPPRPS
jgi:hypothetical protein